MIKTHVNNRLGAIKGTNANIITEYAWCAKDPKEIAGTIPKIEITFWQQDMSSILQSLDYWGDKIGNAVASAVGVYKEGENINPNIPGVVRVGQQMFGVKIDPYKDLYKGERIATYTFPYYASYHHVISNQWGENKGIGSIVEKSIVQIAKQIMPSAGILSPKTWEGLNTNSIPIEMVLLNTTSHSSIEKNMQLIENLLVLNAPLRINAVSQLPPVICEANIPGIRWIPAAYFSQLQIDNLGQPVHIGGKNIPEAYKISFIVTELHETSRQIVKEKQRVRSISTSNVFGGTEYIEQNKSTTLKDVDDYLRKVRGF
jgi:hypothetical protein